MKTKKLTSIVIVIHVLSNKIAAFIPLKLETLSCDPLFFFQSRVVNFSFQMHWWILNLRYYVGHPISNATSLISRKQLDINFKIFTKFCEVIL